MIYIMVTNWEQHWDKLKGNSTYYTTRMFKPGMDEAKLKENTTTIFLKRNPSTRNLERTWIGKTFGFNKSNYGGKDRIFFSVRIEREVSCPAKYQDFFEGWYVDDEDTAVEPKPVDTSLDPKFFTDLETTTDWRRFEERTYWLLKCLGIHNSHRFGPSKQKGKADGFFKFGGFAVLYDCTLDPGFESSKQTQIQNFCDQLQKGSIEYEGKKVNVRDCGKNVWIVTRSTSPKLRNQIDDVFVKEVPISKLIGLYRKRINEDFDETALEQELRNL